MYISKQLIFTQNEKTKFYLDLEASRGTDTSVKIKQKANCDNRIKSTITINSSFILIHLVPFLTQNIMFQEILKRLDVYEAALKQFGYTTM